jgi:predicted PurR-regulated permease PerM
VTFCGNRERITKSADEPGKSSVTRDHKKQSAGDQVPASFIETAIRLAVLALLLYWSFVLVQPFISIFIWSVVLAVALFPVFEWISFRLGGRRRLAAAITTVLSLLVIIGPATWLAMGLVDSVRMISDRLDPSLAAIPSPPVSVKDWPLIGEPIYQFWDLASTNLSAAFATIIPQLKPLGGRLLRVGADTGLGIIKFLIAVLVAGFLFSPAPSLAAAVKRFSRRLNPDRGEELVVQAAATIRAVSRGVIGISMLQALLAGIGLMAAGIPQASLIAFAVLILGIIQIGPTVVIVPVIIWSWMSMETTSALLFTVYMVPVNLLDNLLRPLVMGRGLKTPILVILIGVIGGTLAYGISGLFLGPIVLAVIWELMVAWIKEHETE